MRITMYHPEHWEKVVYLDDIDAHRAEGWRDATEPEAAVAKPEPAAVDTDPLKPRRGRPPKDK